MRPYRFLQNQLKDLLRAMGHNEANSSIKPSDIQANRWRQSAQQLLQSLTEGANIDLGKNITDLTIVPDHFYWYVPFETLPLNGEETEALLSRIRIRYAPTLGLSQRDGRGRKQSGEWAIVQGQLYPGEDLDVAQRVTNAVEQLVPKSCVVGQSFKMHGHTFVSLLDGLLVQGGLLTVAGPAAETPTGVGQSERGPTAQVDIR